MRLLLTLSSGCAANEKSKTDHAGSLDRWVAADRGRGFRSPEGRRTSDSAASPRRLPQASPLVCKGVAYCSKYRQVFVASHPACSLSRTRASRAASRPSAEAFTSIKGTGKFDGRCVCVVAAEAAFSSYRTEMPWLALLFAEHAQGELDSVARLACRDVQGQAQCLRQGQAHSLYFSAYWTPPCQSHSPLPTRPRCESS